MAVPTNHEGSQAGHGGLPHPPEMPQEATAVHHRKEEAGLIADARASAHALLLAVDRMYQLSTGLGEYSETPEEQYAASGLARSPICSAHAARPT